MVELNPDGASSGSGMYARYCAGCHGANLEGSSDQSMPALTDLRERLSPEEVQSQIARGTGFMPSFGFLSADEVITLTSFLFGDRQTEASTDTSEEVVRLSRFFAGSPYGHTGYNRFFDPDGYPAVKPPWGTLNAINLNTGRNRMDRATGRIR